MRLLLSFLIVALLVVAPAFAADLSGKWTGTVEVKTPDGELVTQPAFADLRVKEKEVTGTAGGGDSNESFEIQKGTFDGKKLDFQVTAQEGRVYKISLTPAGEDGLEGTIDFTLEDGTALHGKMNLKRDAKR